MARHSIVEKLQSEPHRLVETEMQVVYILVEVRKLLEHNSQKDLYPVLNFHGNYGESEFAVWELGSGSQRPHTHRPK